MPPALSTLDELPDLKDSGEETPPAEQSVVQSGQFASGAEGLPKVSEPETPKPDTSTPEPESPGPDLLTMEHITPKMDDPVKTVGGKQLVQVGTVSSDKAPQLIPVGEVKQEDLDPSQIVQHNPTLAVDTFKKQHANDSISPLDVIMAPFKFDYGVIKGLATGVPALAKSAVKTAQAIGTATGMGDIGATSKDQLSTPEEREKAQAELYGGAAAGAQSALDILHGTERNASRAADLLTLGTWHGRDKNLSDEDIKAILTQQARSRELHQAVLDGDLAKVTNMIGTSEDWAKDHTWTKDDLKRFGYSGEDAESIGMTLNPINYVPFGRLVPPGIAGAGLELAAKGFKYSGSILDNPFIRWNAHYSPVTASIYAAGGHWTPAMAFAASKVVPPIGRALKAVGDVAEEAGFSLRRPEDYAMLKDFQQLGGVKPSPTRQAGLAVGRAMGMSAAQMGPFAAGAQSPQEAGELIGFGAGMGAFGLGMHEALKAGLFLMDGGKPINLSRQGFVYGHPDDIPHAETTANWDPNNVALLNQIRHAMQGIGTVFALPESVFDMRHPEADQASGVFIDDKTKGKFNIEYRGEKGFLASKDHEPTHYFVRALGPEDRAELNAGLLKRNDPSEFGSTYYSKKFGVPIAVDFDSLPDKRPNQGDPYKMTKDEVMEEMAVDAISHLNFNEITQNPNLIRKLQIGAGMFAEKLGLPVTPKDRAGIFGANPSYHAIAMIEDAARRRVVSAVKQGPTYGTKLPDPNIHFQDLSNAIRAMGYSAGEAKSKAAEVIQEAKDQNRPVDVQALFSRAMTGRWPVIKAPPPPVVLPKAAAPAQAAAPAGPAAPPPSPGSRIAGPALNTPEGVIKGKVGETHADLMQQGIQAGNVSAADALGTDQNHLFHDTDGNLHSREAAAQIAVAAGQAPEGTTSLQSEDLTPSPLDKVSPTKAGEPRPLSDFLMSRLTTQEAAHIHRLIESGVIKNNEDLLNHIADRMRMKEGGERGNKLRALNTLQQNQEPFTVTFTKADGTERTMNAQFGVKKDVKGTRGKLPEDPGLYTVFDKDKDQYRTFKIDQVKSIEQGGKKMFMPKGEGEFKDKIESPAVKVSGMIFKGSTYKDALDAAREFGYEPKDIQAAEKGFVTTKGAFKTPDQAGDFAAERGQMGKQLENVPLRTQDFNRSKRFMPASGDRNKLAADLRKIVEASDPNSDNYLTGIVPRTAKQAIASLEGTSRPEDAGLLSDLRKILEASDPSSDNYLTGVVSRTAKQALSRLEQSSVGEGKPAPLKQFLAENPDLVNLGTGLTPAEQRRYDEIRKNPEPSTEEADEFSALTDKINAHTEEEGAARRGEGGMKRALAKEVTPQATRIPPPRFYAERAPYTESGWKMVDRLTGERHHIEPGEYDSRQEAEDHWNHDSEPLPESWPNVSEAEKQRIINPPPDPIDEFKMSQSRKWLERSQDQSLSPEERAKALRIHQRLATEAGRPEPKQLEGPTIDIEGKRFMPSQEEDEPNLKNVKISKGDWISQEQRDGTTGHYQVVRITDDGKRVQLRDDLGGKHWLSMQDAQIAKHINDVQKYQAARFPNLHIGEDIEAAGGEPDYNFDRGPGWYIANAEHGEDLGEGPWDTKREAQEFADAEVGVKYKILKKSGEAPEKRFMPDSGFYSQLEKTIEDKMPNRASPDQIRGIITKGGVKKAELDWNSPLRDLLDQGKPLSKDEVLAAVRAGTPKLEEKVLGQGSGEVSNMLDKWMQESGYVGAETWGDWDQINEELDQLSTKAEKRGETAQANEYFDLAVEALQHRDELRGPDAPIVGGTQFHRPELNLPGGENYREILVSMPDDRSKQGTFLGSHFDTPNLVGHLRVDDRTTADGQKMTFIQEAQSDWATQGRRQGFIGEEKRPFVPQEDLPPGWQDVTDYKSQGVPDMPFKGEGWKRLLLRTAIKKAVEAGHDLIGWTTGAQQAARYDLSKQVDSIAYNLNSHSLRAYGKEEDASSLPEPIIEKVVPPEKLADFIGKEAADKILKTKPDRNGIRNLSNQDLKIGGEGLRNLYSRDFVNIANDIGKKYGARVQDATLDINHLGGEGLAGLELEKPTTVHSLPITDAMRADVQEHGQKMFMPKHLADPEVPFDPKKEENYEHVNKVVPVKSTGDYSKDDLTSVDTNGLRHVGQLDPELRFMPKMIQTEGGDEYYKPGKLLDTGSDPKTSKGEPFGVRTYIMYLSAQKGSGVVNVCKFATEECTAACLGKGGMGTFDSVKDARTNKTKFWHYDEAGFNDQIDKEITKAKAKAAADGMKLAIRLNGTSDILWENSGIMQKHPDVQFYDYTKYPSLLRKNLPDNYHLTYSYTGKPGSEAFSKTWNDRNGTNTAVVFGNGMPATFMGRPVVDGDVSDLRFMDPKGVIVGLHAKGPALKLIGLSPFIVPTKPEDVAIPYIRPQEKARIIKTQGQDAVDAIKDAAPKAGDLKWKRGNPMLGLQGKQSEEPMPVKTEPKSKRRASKRKSVFRDAVAAE